MTQQSNPTRAATHDEIIEIVGELEDDAVAKIIAAGATSAQVLEAHTWLRSDDYLHRALHHAPQGTVGDVCGILEAELAAPEDPARDR